MKVEFADSFWESLKTLERRDRWYNVAWRTIRYNIPNFLKNVWYFRAELYDFEPWDYRFNLNLFQKSLESTADYLENYGIEEDESRMKKVAKIRRAIELLKRDKEANWMEQAEAELGEMKNSADPREDTPEEFAHNRKVLKRYQEIQQKEWNELWRIIKGTKYKTYEDWDGSDIRGWWD
jgi:hypothetical protein